MSRWSGSTIRRHARPEEDKVTQDVAIEVFRREEGRCLAAKLTERHKCSGRKTLGHVPCRGRNALGKRAPSTPEHLVVICLGASNDYWEERNRENERDHLAIFYPEYHVDGRCPALDD